MLKTFWGTRVGASPEPRPQWLTPITAVAVIDVDHSQHPLVLTVTESGFPEKRSTAVVPDVETITEAPTGGSACPLAHLAETVIEEMAIIVPLSTEAMKKRERGQRTIEDAVKVIALDDIASVTRATTETDRQEHVEAFPVLAPPFHAPETHHRGAFNGQRAPFHLS